jgi:hypothetical protein
MLARWQTQYQTDRARHRAGRSRRADAAGGSRPIQSQSRRPRCKRGSLSRVDALLGSAGRGAQCDGSRCMGGTKSAEESDFPDTVCEVVREGGESPPCQFSYWCDGEPETPQNEEAWERAREVAAGMLNKPPPDPTNGALFFHSVEIAPPWTKERKRTATIGRHIFYR